MKKILKFSAIAALCLSVFGLSGCKNDELDTDQYAGGVALSAISPNPVMRGGKLTILGNDLDKVREVRLAGGVSITEIEVVKAGAHGEICVSVPLEGPEPGQVSLVTDKGKIITSLAELTFTEPIEFDSFSPAEVLSGDVITITGEYLNDVREVILGGDVYVTEFESQSRHELKFVVPGNAVSGFIILGDVDQTVDENSIPNLIYSETELVVNAPTVVKAADAVVKSGSEITVTGEHLDMIETVNLTGASDVEFTVSEDGTTLTFILPASATDGDIILVSYAGDEFNAGTIETVTVADLVIASKAEDGRYKAGTDVLITGSDLDLVTKVDFTNAEASWYFSDGSIVATVPAAAKDGSVTVTLASGKQAYTEAIEVVKPVLTSVDKTEAKAGEDVVTVNGSDLDLVTSVTIGTKDQTFIPCEFSLSEGNLEVNIPDAAYDGPLTLTADSGYDTVSEQITITYGLPVAITFDSPSYALGRSVSISGSKLLQIESISIRGNKVTSYSVRTDAAMTFALPDAIVSPGVYRLELKLLDGTELTWPVPFEVTAPFTETFIWQGSQFINGWNGVTFGDDRFIWQTLGMKAGDVIKIYFTAPEEGWWDLQVVTGHWGDALSIEELNWGNEIKPDLGFPGGSQSFAFNVTEALLARLTEDAGWGGALILNGDGNIEVTGISLIQYGAAETVVWEGTSDHTGDYDNNITLGGENDWIDAGLYEGAEVRIYFTADNTSDWSVQVFAGHWENMKFVTPNGEQWNNENSPEAIENGYVSFIAEGDAYKWMTTGNQNWGGALILQGKNIVFTKLAYL